MYRCQTCGRRFSEPKRIVERHGLPTPPYEERGVCPFCGESNASPIVNRCRCCGTKMAKEGLYCCDACRKRAEIFWENEKRRKQAEEPLNRILRQKREYNRRHGTAYSYGQYVALVEEKRKEKKKCTKTKRNT